MPLLVVKGSQPPLFGRNWLSRVKLDWKPICSIRVSGAGLPHDVQIQLTNTIQCHPNVFKTGLGVTRGITAKLEKKPDVEPMLASPVPCAFQEAVGGEFHLLESKDIVEKVGFSLWATPMVHVPKADGTTWSCGDYAVTVNPRFNIPQYPISLPMSLSSCKGQNDSASLIQ